MGKGSSSSSCDYQVLLVASSFMSPSDSRNWTNINRVRIFGWWVGGAHVVSGWWVGGAHVVGGWDTCIVNSYISLISSRPTSWFFFFFAQN